MIALIHRLVEAMARTAGQWVTLLDGKSHAPVVRKLLRRIGCAPKDTEAQTAARRIREAARALDLTEGGPRMIAEARAFFHEGQVRSRFMRRRVIPVAATIAMLVIAISVTIDRRSIETAVGETRQLSLSDGSVVVLNGDSRLAISLGPWWRSVSLDRGEAYFEVKHDPTRPFVVFVSGYRVTDLGTRFDVSMAPHAFAVAVANGSVQIDRKSPASPKVPYGRLDEGGVANIDINRGQARIGRIEPSLVASWRSGWLIFKGVSLDDAIAQVNRHCKKPLVSVEPSIGEKRISGRFRAGEIAAFLLTLKDLYHLETREAADHIDIYQSS